MWVTQRPSGRRVVACATRVTEPVQGHGGQVPRGMSARDQARSSLAAAPGDGARRGPRPRPNVSERRFSHGDEGPTPRARCWLRNAFPWVYSHYYLWEDFCFTSRSSEK